MTTLRLSLLGPLVFFLGCSGGSGVATNDVSGKVLLNDKALDKGDVLFFPSDGKPPLKFEISNGQFSGKAPPGKYKVQLSATKEMKNTNYDPNSPGSTPTAIINVIPARWGGESKEMREVTASGPNTFEFKLD